MKPPRSSLVAVPVMTIGVVLMSVTERLVGVNVFVPAVRTDQLLFIMVMLVVFVVSMPMVMCDLLMSVLVLVAFAKVQPNTKSHE